MALDGFVGLALGAVGLGVVHGLEPGHGWPVAATYALDRSNKWLAGLAAGTVLGIGHLVSSIAMVLAFFWATDYVGLQDIHWMNYVAGGLLILLGLREYRMYRSGEHHHGHPGGHGSKDDTGADPDGHGHVPNGGHAHAEDDHGHGPGDGHARDHAHGDSHGDDHAHSHGHDHGHGHEHDHGGGLLGRIVAVLPVDLEAYHDPGEATDRGIVGIAAFAFALGFAHEEEFEIIALCAGSTYCLELMLVYALTVVAAIVASTLLLIAGYEHYEDRVAAYAEYLPVLSAVVLVAMGLGFLLGLF